MKRRFFFGLIAVSAGLFYVTNSQAQDTTTIGEDLKNAGKKTGKAVARGAKKVGNKTAEVASKGKSGVVDQVYQGKRGPGGETIYIDGQSRYYYIDKKGHKQYLKQGELKDKKS